MNKDQKGAVDFIIVAAIFLVIAFFALMVYRFSTKGVDDAPVASDETSEQATEEVGEEQPADNSENEPAQSADFTEPYVADGGYVCNGYWIENRLEWNTWYATTSDGLNCYLSTSAESEFVNRQPGEVTEDAAVVISFKQTASTDLDSYLDERYSGSEDWSYPVTVKERVSYRFRIGSGSKVVTEGGRLPYDVTTYFYYDGGTVIEMFHTETTNLEHEARAIQMIGTLSRVQ